MFADGMLALIKLVQTTGLVSNRNNFIRRTDYLAVFFRECNAVSASVHPTYRQQIYCQIRYAQDLGHGYFAGSGSNVRPHVYRSIPAQMSRCSGVKNPIFLCCRRCHNERLTYIERREKCGLSTVLLFLLFGSLTGTLGCKVTHSLAPVTLHVDFVTVDLWSLIGLAQERFSALFCIA